MADKKISALSAAATPLAGSEVLPIVQGGTTVQVSIANVTAGRAVSTGALSVVGANATLDNAFSLAGKLVAGTPVGMMRRNSSDEVAIDEDGYGAKIGFGGRFAFAGGGNFTVGIGNVIMGTAGKGIDFSANSHAAGMTSELLNDYEEGVWTPSQGAGLTVVGTFSSNGTYTKVGRMVTVRGIVASTTTVSCTSAGIICQDLPYASALDMAGSYFNGTLSSGGVVDAAGSSVYAVGAIAATSGIYFNVTYFV